MKKEIFTVFIVFLVGINLISQEIECGLIDFSTKKVYSYDYIENFIKIYKNDTGFDVCIELYIDTVYKKYKNSGKFLYLQLLEHVCRISDGFVLDLMITYVERLIKEEKEKLFIGLVHLGENSCIEELFCMVIHFRDINGENILKDSMIEYLEKIEKDEHMSNNYKKKANALLNRIKNN